MAIKWCVYFVFFPLRGVLGRAGRSIKKSFLPITFGLQGEEHCLSHFTMVICNVHISETLKAGFGTRYFSFRDSIIRLYRQRWLYFHINISQTSKTELIQPTDDCFYSPQLFHAGFLWACEQQDQGDTVCFGVEYELVSGSPIDKRKERKTYSMSFPHTKTCVMKLWFNVEFPVENDSSLNNNPGHPRVSRSGDLLASLLIELTGYVFPSVFLWMHQNTSSHIKSLSSLTSIYCVPIITDGICAGLPPYMWAFSWGWLVYLKRLLLIWLLFKNFLWCSITWRAQNTDVICEIWDVDGCCRLYRLKWSNFN